MLYFFINLKYSSIFRVLGLLTILLSLVACGDGKSDDLKAYVESVKSRPASKVEPLRDPAVYESYQYQSDSQRDPLKPSFTISKIAPARTSMGIGGPNMERERGQLERYPVDSLHYIGSLHRGETAWGLIKTPDGEIVRITLGDYVGQDHGRVTLVDSERVELLELIPDGIGGWEQRTVSLALNG